MHHISEKKEDPCLFKKILRLGGIMLFPVSVLGCRTSPAMGDGVRTRSRKNKCETRYFLVA